MANAAFAPGDEVTWTYETRGGWGYVWKVPVLRARAEAAAADEPCH